MTYLMLQPPLETTLRMYIRLVLVLDQIPLELL